MLHDKNVSVWDDIKDKLSVEEVIADYIPLVQAGANYKAVCPFHQEKTPSLMISPSKGIWHCFGCGEGGDIFAFVSQIENIDKQETLQRLAKKASVNLKKYDQKPTNRTDFKKLAPPGVLNKEQEEEDKQSREIEQGYKLLEWTADLYHKYLLKLLQDYKHPVTIYCRRRKLSRETIETFHIGYAPKGNIVLSLARKHGLPISLLTQVGVLKENDKGVSDKFKDRLMIPINSQDGRVVGFTGRVLPGDTFDRPKYLNSSQSAWFNKSELWFGLDLARGSIIRQKSAIIVEGNMDVISCYQAGLTTTIASQGTSFTTTQLRLLKRLTKRISLAFDNDEAGIAAGKKFFIQATELGLNVDRLVIPPAFKDIDEFINQDQDKESSDLGLQITATDSEKIKTIDSVHADGVIQSSSIGLSLEIIPFFQWYASVKSSSLRSDDMNLQRQAIEDCIEIVQVMDAVAREQSLKLMSQITGLSTTSMQSLITKPLSEVKSLSDKDEDVRIEYPDSAKKVNPLINAWKNYISLKKDDTGATSLLRKLFGIIKVINPAALDQDSLDGYIDIHRAELEYIAEELKESGISGTNESRILNQLMLELDREAFVVSLQPDVVQSYIEIKQQLLQKK